ncbi:phospho-sugar mutase [Candidatus Similichlamydia laticola]|uniref:D-Ribose 1,5-phosphomutase n=1 Tax=Candidatus Similichlamydia laticola TaxID=2170265 RepID=A0A369KDX1_9BACT|nr:phospho-sugar mutase [Candidatus Similichlamydia laticola]RDB31650.1 D-Ribose 1,5-phosphomutase [Candidatus Similichlamydia laticola]
MYDLKQFSPTTRDRIITWLAKDELDLSIREKILHLLKSNTEEIEDAFGCDLCFGTAGIRRKLGPGPNRINIYTIRAITNALLECFSKEKQGCLRLAIGYDTRQESSPFAHLIAQIAVEQGHTALLFPQPVPTPLLSFAIRYRSCDLGIMLTASHNTPDYSGYKVYLSDGRQIQSPLDQEICKRIEITLDVQQGNSSKKESGQLLTLEEDVFDAYLEAIDALPFQKGPKKARIVYTSLEGSGFPFTLRALTRWGFQPQTDQKEQNILTRKKSNPEEREALEEGISFLKREHGHILLANDPDADRIGLVSREGEEVYHFSGNEIALLILDYLGRTLGSSCQGKWIAKSFVSTKMIDALAKSFHLQVQTVPTGFKYIAQYIAQLEREEKASQFLMGMEESSGILVGTHVRDKDGVSTCCVLAALTEDALKRNSSPLKELYRITDTIGFFFEETLSFPLSPKQSFESILNSLRKKLTTLGGLPFTQATHEIPLGARKDSSLWEIEKKGRLIIRASGTEPKLKCYLSLKGKREKCEVFQKVKQDLIQIMNSCLL